MRNAQRHQQPEPEPSRRKPQATRNNVDQGNYCEETRSARVYSRSACGNGKRAKAGAPAKEELAEKASTHANSGGLEPESPRERTAPKRREGKTTKEARNPSTQKERGEQNTTTALPGTNEPAHAAGRRTQALQKRNRGSDAVERRQAHLMH